MGSGVRDDGTSFGRECFECEEVGPEDLGGAGIMRLQVSVVGPVVGHDEIAIRVQSCCCAWSRRASHEDGLFPI